MTTKLNSQPTYTELMVNDVPAARFTEQGIAFDNTGTGLTATNVQDAVSELVGKSFGVGQTWQNMVPARALNTTYTNTTGKLIKVYVRAVLSVANEALLALGDFTPETILSGLSHTGNAAVVIHFEVPPGKTYQVGQTGGTATLSRWLELRS